VNNCSKKTSLSVKWSWNWVKEITEKMLQFVHYRSQQFTSERKSSKLQDKRLTGDTRFTRAYFFIQWYERYMNLIGKQIQLEHACWYKIIYINNNDWWCTHTSIPNHFDEDHEKQNYPINTISQWRKWELWFLFN